MHCSRCSTQNPENAKFCLECGSPLSVTATACEPALHPAEAERRQLTCLSCDLVNSVELSERVDPEQLREILATYRRVCTTVVRRFDGHVHDYSGDGIMVYFGFPSAHEDDAQRAVRSGLGIVEAVGQLSRRLSSDRGIDLHVRVGIDTGLVVAGSMTADDDLRLASAVGVTPNLAARLQSLAAADSVVISAAAYRLIAGFFDCRELGFQPIRGISQPMAIYEVLHESAARTRLDVAAQRGLPPMHGRDDELRRLTERWTQARAGHGSAALVEGEPGIGKSRLIRSLQEHVAQSPDAFLIPLTGSPYHSNTAFHPVVAHLERVLELAPEDTVEQRLDKIDGLLAQYGLDRPSVVPLIADLLGVPFENRYPPLDLPADRQRQLTIDALVGIWLTRAGHQPVLLVVEDLHWVDPSTLDLLTHLLERLPESRLLVLLSARPDFTHPWPEGPWLERLDLDRLEREASVSIVTEAADRPLPTDLLDQVLRKADGIPLYLEELTKLVVEQNFLDDGDGHLDPAAPPRALAIPATLADSLTARLDRLTDAKGVAQLGAALGRQFSYALLAAVAATGATFDPEALRYNLARLVDAGLLFVERDARGEKYTFKHALIQDAAYASLLLTTRRNYHQRIAQVLVEQFHATVETAPELLAYHYTQAGMPFEAVPYWLRAGERSLRASAHPEAIAHVTAGLAVLADLPAGPQRAGQELKVRLTLGPAYMAIRGYAAPEVEACYKRARELCQELGDTPQLVPVLHGLWTYHVVRAQHASALALGEQVLDIGAASDDDGLLVEASLEVGWSHFFLGQLPQARGHLTRVLELYDHDLHSSHAFLYGNDPATSARGCLAEVLWLLGDVDQSVQQSDENLAILRSRIEHPFSVAFGLVVTATMRQFLRDPAGTRALAEEALVLSEKYGLPFIGAMASILRGWALTSEGEFEQGLAEMRRGLAAQLATGAHMARPYWLYLIADACRRTGAADDGLELIDAAGTAVEDADERDWEAEIHRLRGELLLAVGEPARSDVAPLAESSFRRALEVARRQGARSLELRAAVSLSGLLRREGRDDEARDLLARVYSWFTEGFDTPDLREAAALAADLGIPTGTAAHVAAQSGGH
jgi:class 3 adenylate cyclase/predicted ATPase